MHIIKARLEDVNELTDLINAAYQPEAEWKSSPRIGNEEVITLINGNNSSIFKGISDKEIICCASSEIRFEMATFGLLSVWPRYQDKGYGYQMICFLEQSARLNGCKTMRCGVASFNTHLMSYYEKMGYIHYDSKPWNEPSLLIEDVTFELYEKAL